MSTAQLGVDCADGFVRAFVTLPYRMHDSGIQAVVAATVLGIAACFAWRAHMPELKLLFVLSVVALAIHYGLVMLKVYPPTFGIPRYTLALSLNLWFALLAGMLKVAHPRLRTLWLAILIVVSVGSVTVRYRQDGTNGRAERGEFIARASQEVDVVIVDAPESAPRFVYHAPDEATVIALSQNDLLKRWEELKERISRSDHVLYVASLYPLRAQAGTRHGMESVIKKLRETGLKLEASTESDTLHVFYFGQP